MADALVHRTFSILGSSSLLSVVLIAFIVGPASTLSNAQTGFARPPEWDAKMAALHNAGTGLVPLFVLGDVNEDGKVDEQDLELVRSIVQSGTEPRPSAAISCPAVAILIKTAASINATSPHWPNGFRQKVTAPALSYQAALPCDFNRSFIAASPFAKRGGAAQIRFLDAGLNATNTVVIIEEGNAVVGSASDGRGYEVIVLAAAKTGQQIVLKISLPGARTYYYTLPVEDAP